MRWTIGVLIISYYLLMLPPKYYKNAFEFVKIVSRTLKFTGRTRHDETGVFDDVTVTLTIRSDMLISGVISVIV